MPEHNEQEDTLYNLDTRKPSGTGILGRRGLLVVVSGKSLGKTLVLSKGEKIIGRRDDCDLVISDELLSRQHCKITTTENQEHFIEDLDSTNSTWLNSKQLNGRIQLHYGDRILIGRTILRFLLEEEITKH